MAINLDMTLINIILLCVIGFGCIYISILKKKHRKEIEKFKNISPSANISDSEKINIIRDHILHSDDRILGKYMKKIYFSGKNWEQYNDLVLIEKDILELAVIRSNVLKEKTDLSKFFAATVALTLAYIAYYNVILKIILTEVFLKILHITETETETVVSIVEVLVIAFVTIFLLRLAYSNMSIRDSAIFFNGQFERALKRKEDRI